MLKIPPDSTFVVQMLVFAVLFFVLRRWWFEPALRVIEERRRRSEGAVVEARAMEAEVVRLRAEQIRFHARSSHIRVNEQRLVPDLRQAGSKVH